MATLAMAARWLMLEHAAVNCGNMANWSFEYLDTPRHCAPVAVGDVRLLTVFDGAGLDGAALADQQSAFAPCVCVLPLEGARDVRPAPGCIEVATDRTLDEVVRLLQRELLRLQQWESRMTRSTIAHGTFQDFIDAGEGIIPNYITVTDSAFRLLAYTPYQISDDPWLIDLVEKGYFNKEQIDRFRRSNALARWEAQRMTVYSGTEHYAQYPFINHVFHLDDGSFVRMVMSLSNEPYSQGLFDLFEVLVGHMEDLIANSQRTRRARFSHNADFLASLLAGQPQNLEYAAAQADRLGIFSDTPLVVYALQPGKGQGANLWYLAGEINLMLPDCLVARYDGCLYAALKCLPYKLDDDITRADKLMDDLGERYSTQVGRGAVTQGLRSVEMAGKQARQAIELARAVQQSSQLNTFDSLVAAYLVRGDLSDGAFVRYSIDHGVLGALRAKDQRDATNDASFLRAYLDCERRIEVTAGRLGMHRNTVRQRAARIQQEFGLDLDIFETRKMMNAWYVLDDMVRLLPQGTS